MKTPEELFQEKVRNEGIMLIDESLIVKPKPKRPAHPYAPVQKTKEEVQEEKINKTHFLSKPDLLLENIKKKFGDVNCLASQHSATFTKDNKTVRFTENEVSIDGDTDAHLHMLMDAYIEAQRARWEAAGKLAEFHISKLKFTAVGNKAERLTELAHQRGIGVEKPVNTPPAPTAPSAALKEPEVTPTLPIKRAA